MWAPSSTLKLVPVSLLVVLRKELIQFVLEMVPNVIRSSFGVYYFKSSDMFQEVYNSIVSAISTVPKKPLKILQTNIPGQWPCDINLYLRRDGIDKLLKHHPFPQDHKVSPFLTKITQYIQITEKVIILITL